MSVDVTKTLERLDIQIADLRAKKKAIENKEKQRAKKEKTRLLIKYGELVEKHLQFKTLEELEQLLIKAQKII